MIGVEVTSEAAAHVRENGGALTLRQSPRHGCCGGTVVLVVAEAEVPRTDEGFARRPLSTPSGPITLFIQLEIDTDASGLLRVGLDRLLGFRSLYVEGAPSELSSRSSSPAIQTPVSMNASTSTRSATPDADTLRQSVRDKYASVARGDTLSCCGPSSDTDGTTEINMIGDAYDGVDGYEEAADLHLGCGLPVEHAGLAPGQTVLDLGAGAGLDAFVARRAVGETGQVLGVDFTPEMVAKARQNAQRLGYTNVRFERGDIEALPFDDASVDVVISNCVLNLVPDKAQAFAETFRVLCPGGHFCVSDVVSRGELPAAVRASAELYAGCVAGAMDQDAYLALIEEAGFDSVEVVVERPIDLPAGLLPDGADAPLFSVTIRGSRPEVAAQR